VLVAGPWLCVLASPYGPALPGYYRSVLANSTLANSISEWAPSTLKAQPLFFALLLASFWLLARSRGSLTGFAQLALAGLGVLGLVAVRYDVWFALAAAAILPRALDTAWAPSEAPRRKSLNLGLALAGLVVGALAVLSVARHGRGWFERDYPAAAARVVAAHPGARVFADERYADWLLFEQPSLAGRVAYDVRFELLPRRLLQAVVDFRKVHGVDWQRAADGYPLLVLDPVGDRQAVRYYRALPGTRVLYGDGNVVVLLRR
jgi:hypothetical protein